MDGQEQRAPEHQRIGAGRAVSMRRPGFPVRESPVWRDVLLRRMLFAADVIACAIAAGSLGIGHEGGYHVTLWALIAAPIWLIAAKLFGLYDADHRSLRHLTADEFPTLAAWALTCAAATTLVLLASPYPPGVDLSLQSFLVRLGAVFALRAAARWAWRRYTPAARTLLVGNESRARTIARKLELFPDTHLQVVARIDRLGADEIDEPGFLREIERVIVVGDSVDETALHHLIAACRRARVKISVIPALHGMFGTAVQLTRVADMPFVEYTTWDVSRSTLALKRVFDVVLAAAGLVVLAPLLVVVALAVLVLDGRPVLFTQVRATQHGRPFRMRKFRSMVRDAEDMLPDIVALDELPEPAFKLIDDPRVTPLGRVLRRFSLDELPQLWNVLVGEMSLVGPRPEQIELVERYSAGDRFRLAVKPGLTGPMQVYGRGHLTFEERLAVERDYIENLSLQRDVRLLAMTISAIWSGRGAF